jgi:23S rRNA U2552 (ribose-2'-O)-methylase RlmE/FtsJ
MDIFVTKPPWESVQFKKNTEPVSFFEMKKGVWEHAASSEEDEIQQYRSKIEKYEKEQGEGTWEYYKKIINPYEFVYTQKKYEDFPESLCLTKPLSRSYFKMIEIINISKFFTTCEHHFIRSAHVCEGPGGFMEGFIDASSHYKRTPKSMHAITLKPKQPNIPGWKRASYFLQKNKKIINIDYGEDGTGDILRYENQNHFIQSCSEKVSLFTGDGGFDFSIDYKNQEESIFPLLIASTRIGFEVLREGGYFILKFFDLYNSATIELLYILSLHFKSWTLYKPATSRPCNPEQYFIGKEFRGANKDTIEYLRSICKDNKSISHIAIPSTEFMREIEEMRTLIVKRQIEYLKSVFNLIENNNTLIIKTIIKEHYKESYKWCKKFNIYVHPHKPALLNV